MTKTLYIFAGSVWAAAAELAVAELGYKAGETIIIQNVNLVQGENFAPSFIKLNPNATLPTLEDGDKVYGSTAEVIAALVNDAPIKVAPGTSIIETIHAEKYDPNFAMLLSRNDAELAQKSGGIAGVFLSGRQVALEKYSQSPEGAPYKAFYETKLAQNGGMLAIAKGTAPPEHKELFFKRSEEHSANIKAALLEVLPGALPDSGFIGGAVPGEDDFHVGAWLTRIAATTGAKSSGDAVAAIETAYGAVPAKVAAYWEAWTARPSWQAVYAGGLH
ncbi:hypothetical protein DFH07DRAFT_864483 [Mycena maculata]|uniref:GST N-terminal domain-containing protein n=1 Tax=Mycena maculata TaxID=230809 RepID=A0AAD7KDH7_9AGAR|nr:hypothetical protein DFH07DRAFT_864483 [Mycena maculata]